MENEPKVEEWGKALESKKIENKAESRKSVAKSRENTLRSKELLIEAVSYLSEDDARAVLVIVRELLKKVINERQRQ